MQTETLSFGAAISALKSGSRVARKGWNGKGMHVYLKTSPAFEPCLVMFTAAKKHQPGWLASQADMLADDWCIVPHVVDEAGQPG